MKHIEKLTNIVNKAEKIFNNTYSRILTHNDLNGAVIPSLIEICLIDAFEEIYGSRVMHGDETNGHDIEHRTFKNLAIEVKATSNVKTLKFAQNVCNGENKFPDKNKRINHLFIAYDKDFSNKHPRIVFKKVFFGPISYNDWTPMGETSRSMYIKKKVLKANCTTIR